MVVRDEILIFWPNLTLKIEASGVFEAQIFITFSSFPN
jgi:hypothetical protein